MATYIPNVTDVFPDIEPFKPDYSFLQSALATKQSQFDAALSQINNVYGTLLNSPLTRDINQQRRDAFFKAADNNIKKITSLDLSLPQNVQMASNVFKPFYDDQNLVKDLTWTKQFNKEVAYADGLRNCLSEECAGKYWDGGVKLLNYQRQDFQNANDQQAMSMGAVKYVPAYNIVDEAVTLAKDQGFNVVYDTIKNGYIVTTKNGQALEGTLATYFTEVFNNNPQARSYMQAQAQLQRYDAIESLLPQFGDDRAAAEMSYLQSNLQPAITSGEKKLNEIQDVMLSLNASRLTYETIRNRRALLPSEQAKYDEIMSQYGVAEKALKSTRDSLTTLKTSFSPDNIQTARNIIDNSVANSLMNTAILKATKVAAYRDTEVSLKADPYALARYESSLAEGREIRKEQREAEKQAVMLGMFDQFSTKPADENVKIDDVFQYQSGEYTNLNSTYTQSVNGILKSLLSGPNKQAALDLMRKYNISSDNLNGKGDIDLRVYDNLFGDIKKNILNLDKSTYAQLAPMIKQADYNHDALSYVSSAVGSNVELVAKILKSDRYKNNPQLIDSIIDPVTKQVKTKEQFVKEGLKQFNLPATLTKPNEISAFSPVGSSFGFMGSTTGQFGMSSARKLEYDYDKLLEDFAYEYNYQRDNLKSTGLAVTGGAGGAGVKNSLVAVADPYKFMSPTTTAVRSLLADYDQGNISIAGMGEDVTANANTILENLRLDMNTYYKEPTADRPLVTVEYTGIYNNTPDQHKANVRINADYINKLVGQGIINKEEAATIAANGITLVVDAQKAQNQMTTSINKDYRDVILRNTGTYKIENPGGAIEFNSQPDGSVSMNGFLNVWNNNDFVELPYNKWYLQQAGGSALFDNTSKLLTEQMLINNNILSQLSR